MDRKFSPERLTNIRRMRKARRLYRQAPLFALVWMQAEYPGYTPEQLADDLRRRTKPKPRSGKYNHYRWGRYRRMERLIAEYRHTRDEALIRQAAQLKRNMTKPYRVLYTIGREKWVKHFPPQIAIERIEQLVSQLRSCRTTEQATRLFQSFSTYPN